MKYLDQLDIRSYATMGEMWRWLQGQRRKEDVVGEQGRGVNGDLSLPGP